MVKVRSKNLFLTGLLLSALAMLPVSAQDVVPFSADDPDYADDVAQVVSNSGKRIDYSRLWVFSAGIHKFENDHLHGGAPAVVLQDVGLIRAMIAQGVPADHVVALRDAEATKANCQAQLESLITRAKPGDFLLLFVHSHGSLARGGLICTYEAGGVWTFDEMIGQVDSQFRGSDACVCIAACHSGSVLETIKSQERRLRYFGVTSVHPDVSALTVATADFEACIKDAFSGAACPDLNRDGVITFAEFGHYVTNDQRLLFKTVPDFGYTNNFDPQLIINNAKPRLGNLDCRLVRLADGTKGRVIKQDGRRILVRGSRNPAMAEWGRAGRATLLGR